MKKLGFGFMRLPVLEDGKVDLAQVSAMVDRFLAEGFTYFDTARPYHSGQSEAAIKACLTDRYPREAYELTDKLTLPFVEKAEDIVPMVESQLEACGVTYFDNYLMHAVNAGRYETFVQWGAFEILAELKKAGKIRRMGLSFHDKPEVLDQILTEQPMVDVVQIQFNYLDLENPGVQSRRLYEICRKHNKPILVMEPVKGGSLANLPPEAAAKLDALQGGSYASYAIRYVASQEGVERVLSGMSNLAQLEDNVSYMADFQPLDTREEAAVMAARDQIMAKDTIQCTACRYCVDGCPMGIDIPLVFHMYDRVVRFLDADWRYGAAMADKPQASACVGCGQCEEACPQKLEIRSLLKRAAERFEKNG